MTSRSARAACALALMLPSLWAGSSLASSPSSKDVERAEAGVDRLSDELGSAGRRLEAARRELATIRARMSASQREVRHIALRLLDRKQQLAALATELYKGGSAGALEAVLTSESIVDLETQLKYLESSQDAHSQEVEELVVDQKLLQRRVAELEDARSQASGLVSQIESVRSQIAARLSSARGSLSELRARLEARRARAAELAARAAELASPPAVHVSTTVDWDAIAMCESGGNWHLDSTYDGGLQMSPETWLGYGGGSYARYAWQATREQQIAIAEKVLAAQGPSAWPHCFQYG